MVWDAATGETMFARELPADPIPGFGGLIGPVGVSFSPDSRRLLDTGGPLHILDARTGKDALALRGHKHQVMNAFWSEGERIASASMDGTIRVWDARTGKECCCLHRRPGGEDPGLLAFSPDGEAILVQEPGEQPAVLAASTGEVKLILQGPRGKVRGAAFSADGWRVATGDEDGTIHVQDAVTGEVELVLKGHSGAVWSVAFSADGRRIVSGAGGKADPRRPGPGELKLWDAVTGQEKLSLTGHAGRVLGAAFSRDGWRLVSASEDSVKVWEAPAADPRTRR